MYFLCNSRNRKSTTNNKTKKMIATMNGIKSFQLTILTVPGARKSIRRVDFPELGEDAAGTSVIKDHIIAWVADGAPGPLIQNLTKKEDTTEQKKYKHTPVELSFGARTLAKFLGEAFVSTIECHLNKKYSLMDLNDFFLSESMNSITRKLVAKRLLLFVPLLARMDLPQDASGNYMLEWSASFLGFAINLRTRRGILYSAGDCLSLSICDNKRTVYGGDSKGRFFCRWKSSPMELKNELFQIKIIKGKSNYIQLENVRQIALMTDGVASKKDLSNVTDVKDIDKHCRNTDDDRTLLTLILY